MRLGLIGYGSIGQGLRAELPPQIASEIVVLVRPAALDTARQAAPDVHFVTTLDALLNHQPTVIVECAGHSAVVEHGENVLRSGVDLVVASIGSFAQGTLYSQVCAAAKEGRARLVLPSGAIGGLDLLSVLAANRDVQVRYQGVKPPDAWKGSAAEEVVDLSSLQDRTVFFRGTGREAAQRYPKNANVVAAIALAGAGFDRMQVKLIADPAALANMHSYEVVAPACRYAIEIENTATSGNARTSLTTVMSLLHEVMKYQGPP